VKVSNGPTSGRSRQAEFGQKRTLFTGNPMGKKWPPRPTKDFRIVSVQYIVEIEANHRRAGFSEIGYEVIQRRFWQLLSFLDRQGYKVGQHQTSVEDVGPSSDLMNFDLNDEGYLFLQRYLDKWHDRLYKDKGAEAEWKFLEKWHSQFVGESLNSTNSVATD
jgi:hypothetical protein